MIEYDVNPDHYVEGNGEGGKSMADEKTVLDLNHGPMRVNMRQHTDGLTATLHATGRKLEISVSDYPGTEDRAVPFNTLDFVVDGARIDVFLSDAQLEDLSGKLANEISIRRSNGRF